MTKQQIKFWILAASAIAIIGGAGPAWASDDHGHEHGHGHAQEDEHSDAHEGEGEHEHGHEHGAEEGAIHLSTEQIAAAGIAVAPVSAGAVGDGVSVPGRIVPDAARMAQVVPKIGGTVTVVHKNIGDRVDAGDVLAEIESREMAEAAAEFHAAAKSEEIARHVLGREKALWEKKITAEQEYLDARNAYQEAAIRTDLARQKLKTLGHDGKGKISSVHPLRAPIAGRIIERDITQGAFANPDKAAFTVADLSVVWVDVALPPADIAAVMEGQTVRVRNGAAETTGTVIFISPAIDPETGAAKAIINIDNADGTWRPGLFVNADIVTANAHNTLSVPRAAIQTIDGKQTVFVRTAEGFEKRNITTGKESSGQVEILSGVIAGETIAVTNSFTLKAELGKAEAEHVH